MLPVGCKDCSQAIAKEMQLVARVVTGCHHGPAGCQGVVLMAVMGFQVVAMMFIGGFYMISSGCQVVAMILQVIAVMLLTGCYDNPVGCQGIARFPMYQIMIKPYVCETCGFGVLLHVTHNSNIFQRHRHFPVWDLYSQVCIHLC